jgi:hypothetical protein
MFSRKLSSSIAVVAIVIGVGAAAFAFQTYQAFNVVGAN